MSHAPAIAVLLHELLNLRLCDVEDVRLEAAGLIKCRLRGSPCFRVEIHLHITVLSLLLSFSFSPSHLSLPLFLKSPRQLLRLSKTK